MPNSHELFSIPQAAVVLNVPEGWLRKKVSAGEVPHARLGKHVRFTRAHLSQIVADAEAPIMSAPAASNGLSQRARRGQLAVANDRSAA